MATYKLYGLLFLGIMIALICALEFWVNFLLKKGQIGGSSLGREVKRGKWNEILNAEVTMPVNMFMARKNSSGKVNIFLAVSLDGHNNAFQFFKMEIS